NPPDVRARGLAGSVVENRRAVGRPARRPQVRDREIRTHELLLVAAAEVLQDEPRFPPAADGDVDELPAVGRPDRAEIVVVAKRQASVDAAHEIEAPDVS